MILGKKFCSTRTRCKTLCVLAIFVIAIHIIWNNISYHYMSKKIVAKSEIKNIKSDNHVFSTPQISHLRPIKKVKSVKDFRIEKIVDNDSSVFNHPKVLRHLQKPVIEKSNVNKLEQQKVKCENNTNECQLNKTFDKILEYFRIGENETRDSFVNLHRYGYYPDSNACRQKSDVVVLVHSKFDHFHKRRRIRSTWASNRIFNGKTFTTVFFLGEPSISQMEHPKSGSKDEADQGQAWLEKQERLVDDMRQSIYKEAADFGDIVMGNFTDAYRNLTIKHIMALHWAVTNCRQVEYLAKVDDDALVNVFSLASYVSSKNRCTSGFLACMLPKIRTPFRKSGAKWFVNQSEYPFSIFPLWCMGFGEIMTRDVAQSLLKTSRDVRTFWVDDVYVTGLLRHKAGFQVVDMYSLFDYNKTSFFVLPKYVKNYSFKSFWNQIVADNRRHIF